MKLSQLAITNYQFTLVLIFLLVISGTTSFLTMPRTEDPAVAPLGTNVLVIYPGASPADMEELVADPIEEKLNELDHIKEIESICRDSLSLTGVEFHTGVDMDETYSKLVQKINSIRDDLPQDIMSLDIIRWVMSDFVIILQVALSSEEASFQLLEEEADRLKKMLEKVNGIKKVKKWAVPEQQVRISLDMAKLAQKQISMNQIVSAIQASNYNIPGGNIDISSKRFNINTSGTYRSLEEIRDTIIHAHEEKVIFLKDIAEVEFDYEDNLYLARTQGARSVFVTVNQKEDSNIFQLMEQINEQIAAFKEKLPPSISLSKVFDQSESVAKRLNGFFTNLLQGLILVGIVILLSVGLRASIIVILAIPISILTSFGFLDMSGYGIQQMVIAGLVIALGLLVDNAIVVTENISRFMKMGYSNQTAAVKGTGQIGWAIVSSTATTVLAFLPITLMGYTTGDYIRSMPMTVIFALSASLLVALTLTPFLSSRFLRVGNQHKEIPFRRVLNFMIQKTYRPSLAYALRHPWQMVILVTLIFSLSLYLFQFIGVSLFPMAEKPQLIINIETPEGTNLEKTDSVTRYVEDHLAQRPEIKTYASNIGRGNPQIHYGIDSPESKVNHAQIFLELYKYERRQMAKITSELREEFGHYPGARIEIKELSAGPPVEAPVAIKILGEELEILKNIAMDVEKIFLATPGTINVNNPQSTTKTELQIQINRAKAGMLGIPLVEIDRTIRAAIAGITVSQYRDIKGKEYDMVVRLPIEDKPQLEDLERIYVTSLTGAHIPLKQIATIGFKSGPKQINHYNFDRTVTVTADVKRGESVNRITQEIIAKLDEYAWPKGYQYYVTGEMESQQESFGGMGKAIIIAMIAIFAILVLQFKSFAQPLIVFTAIPLAVIGSILALLITGNTFSFTAFVGLTSLVGIVVNNSIILVDYTNKLRDEGKILVEALKTAGQTRFIPIVLTTATTIGGLLPLTLRGGTMWGPMGWTIIGGLIASTFLTLIMVPVLYQFFTPNNKSKPKLSASGVSS